MSAAATEQARKRREAGRAGSPRDDVARGAQQSPPLPAALTRRRAEEGPGALSRR